MICVSIGNKDINEIEAILDTADFAELRYDLCNIPIEFIDSFFSENRKIIATYRKVDGLDDSVRFEFLKKSIDYGAFYIDIDPETDSQFASEIIGYARQKSCGIIASRHFFDKALEIESIKIYIDRMLGLNPDIVKIVFNPGEKDCIATIRQAYDYFSRAGQQAKLICFGLGEGAKSSRVESFRLGAPFVYACPDDGQATAAGQLSLSDARQIFRNNIKEQK